MDGWGKPLADNCPLTENGDKYPRVLRDCTFSPKILDKFLDFFKIEKKFLKIKNVKI